MVSGDTHLSESMIRFENEKKKQQCDLQHEAYTLYWECAWSSTERCSLNVKLKNGKTLKIHFDFYFQFHCPMLDAPQHPHFFSRSAKTNIAFAHNTISVRSGFSSSSSSSLFARVCAFARQESRLFSKAERIVRANGKHQIEMFSIKELFKRNSTRRCHNKINIEIYGHTTFNRKNGHSIFSSMRNERFSFSSGSNPPNRWEQIEMVRSIHHRNYLIVKFANRDFHQITLLSVVEMDSFTAF